MAPAEMDAWATVLQAAGLPALAVGAIAFLLFKGRTVFSGVLNEWTAKAERERERLEHDRDKMMAAKDAEIIRSSVLIAELRAELVKASHKIEKLLARVARLMQAIGWWRSFATTLHDRWGIDRERFEFHTERHGMPRLDLDEIPVVPEITERETASEFNG